MGYDKHQATLEFRRWSDSYDRCILQWLLFGPSHRALIERIRALSRGRPIRMLDVGCGTGLFASAVRSALPAATVVGIDLVDEMLTKGRARWDAQRGHVLPVQGDSERLPFPPATFDIVTCANSFHHYPRQDRAVGEMCRVLKPGGRLMIIDGYRDNLWGWFTPRLGCSASRIDDAGRFASHCSAGPHRSGAVLDHGGRCRRANTGHPDSPFSASRGPGKKRIECMGAPWPWRMRVIRTIVE
jgi:SAM-dependent methyltransferase